MKNWQRKLLFSFFFSLFLIFGPILVFYSLGYRFDFEKKKVTKTGGIFIKALPKEVTISIDGKKRKTDPIFGSVLIENLLPKKYKIRVEKDGYLSWEKELEVEEGRVAEIKSLVLFPKNLNFYQLLSNVDNFWSLPNQKELILKETENGKWALKIYSLDKKIKSHLVNQDDFGKEAEFLNLDFGDEPDEAEIQVKIKESIKNFVLNLRKPFQIREKEEIKTPENVLCFKKVNGDFYSFEKSGYLLKNEERLNREPLDGIESCQLKIFGGRIFLEASGELYFLKEGKLEKIFENLREIKASPNSTRFVIFSDYEIWIFEGEKIEFLNRFSEKIENVNWVNDDYLIFLSQNKIKVSEIDKRDKLNVYELSDFSGEKLFFSFLNKKIYIQRGNQIFESDPLLR
jgi:fructose-specific component phosphotransferase system IIB-like protein